MKDNKVYTVYVGYDEKDKPAYEVLKFSIERISSVPIQVKPIKLSTVERMGMYNRKFSVNENGQRYDEIDKRPFSTDFSFTRFLIPHLNMYQGMALYMDADMYIRADIKELFDICDDPYYPLWCVHHKYEPKATIKILPSSLVVAVKVAPSLILLSAPKFNKPGNAEDTQSVPVDFRTLPLVPGAII